MWYVSVQERQIVIQNSRENMYVSVNGTDCYGLKKKKNNAMAVKKEVWQKSLAASQP